MKNIYLHYQRESVKQNRPTTLELLHYGKPTMRDHNVDLRRNSRAYKEVLFKEQYR